LPQTCGINGIGDALPKIRRFPFRRFFWTEQWVVSLENKYFGDKSAFSLHRRAEQLMDNQPKVRQ